MKVIDKNSEDELEHMLNFVRSEPKQWRTVHMCVSEFAGDKKCNSEYKKIIHNVISTHILEKGSRLYFMTNGDDSAGTSQTQMASKQTHQRAGKHNTTNTANSRWTSCFAFNAMDSELGAILLSGKPLHLAGQVKINRWGGREEVNFMLDDAALGG